MRHYLFVVEGAHDVAAIASVIKLLGINTEIHSKDKLSEIWHKLVPNKFPFTEDVLDRITPIPSFFQDTEVSIAIKVAGSDYKLFPTLDENLSTFSIEELDKLNGILLFCDADDKPYKERVDYIIKEAKDKGDISFDLDIFIKRKIVKINYKEIKSDIYVFPNNQSVGTLEHLLLQGANIVYKDLLEAASEYVSAVDALHKSKWSKSSENKVLIGCIANVLKPGKANQVSICDNDWISKRTMENCSDIKKLYHQIGDFIKT